MLFDRLGRRWASFKERLGPLRAIVVDDEDFVRELFRDLLGQEGFEVDVAHTAETAWRLITARSYDLLVTDKNLPARSGLELIADVREAGMDLTSVMITGYASLESISEALRLGASDYITKPFDDVMHAVRRLKSVADRRVAERFYARVIDDLQGAMSSSIDKDDLGSIAEELFAFKGSLRRRIPVLVAEASTAGQAWRLAESGVRADRVTNLDEARRRLTSENSPLVAVVGLELPGAVGFIEEVRRDDPLLEVLVTSAVPDLTTSLAALTAGATDFVNITTEGVPALRSRVRRLIDTARRQRLSVYLIAALYRRVREVANPVADTLLDILPPEQRVYLDALAAPLDTGEVSGLAIADLFTDNGEEEGAVAEPAVIAVGGDELASDIEEALAAAERAAAHAAHAPGLSEQLEPEAQLEVLSDSYEGLGDLESELEGDDEGEGHEPELQRAAHDGELGNDDELEELEHSLETSHEETFEEAEEAFEELEDELEAPGSAYAAPAGRQAAAPIATSDAMAELEALAASVSTPALRPRSRSTDGVRPTSSSPPAPARSASSVRATSGAAPRTTPITGPPPAAPRPGGASAQADLAAMASAVGAEGLEHVGRLLDLGHSAAELVHELRQPLSGIKSSAQLLANKPDDSAQLQRHISAILRHVARIEALAERAVRYARAGSAEPVMEVCNVNEAIDRAIALVGLGKRRSVALYRDLDPELPRVMADPIGLEQICVNLLENARAAVPESGRILIRTLADGEWVEAYFEDDGPGVHKDQRARIFEPFVTSKSNGTGLGLHLSRRIAERVGGSLELLDSRVGASFRLRLPILGDAG